MGSTYNSGRTHPGQPKAELKAFDLNSGEAAAFDATGTVTVLNTPLLGTDYFNRIGRKTYMKNLHLRGWVFNNTTVTATDVGRIVIVYDAQPNGALPVVSDIFQNANSAAATNNLANINLNNRQRFTILRDMEVYLPSVTNTAGVLTNRGNEDYIKQSFLIDEFIKLRGMETVYNSVDGGTIADITSGSLLLVTFANNASEDWAFQFGTRLRYYD